MADPKTSIVQSIQDWREEMRQRRETVQDRIKSLQLDQPDVALAGSIRGLVAELRALDQEIEAAERFFDQV